MNHCSACGSPTSQQVPEGDNRLRDVCTGCGLIHYVNPRIIVGTIPIWEEQLLLCRRAIEPRAGFWTLPAGFMELGESTQAGALRETVEEAGASAEVGDLFAVFDIPRAEQVHLFFRAQLKHPGLAPGPESLEARLFHPQDIPWEDLAFRSVRRALELFLADQAGGAQRVHNESITW
jgi:ADP-ribose pyrophosphatase YjhB (NUDIX family)